VNFLNLTWNKIDLINRVIQLDAKDTKDKEARNIPIHDELYSILKAIPRSIHNDHVFLYKGKPVEDIRGGLKTACKNAGISYSRFVKDGFIFHDLPHSFNTHMRKAGIQESVIMAITGHSTREMFDRYNTVDEEDTRKAIDKLQGYFQNSDQSNDQNQKVENQSFGMGSKNRAVNMIGAQELSGVSVGSVEDLKMPNFIDGAREGTRTPTGNPTGS